MEEHYGWKVQRVKVRYFDSVCHCRRKMYDYMNEQNPMIAIVDDDPDILDAMRLLLEMEGYAVVTVQKADSLKSLIEKGTLPNLILLDVLLSGKDGRDVCQELKHQEETKHIPIIIVSAHPSAAKNAIRYGAEDFIAKPFNIDELLQKVKKYMERSYFAN